MFFSSIIAYAMSKPKYVDLTDYTGEQGNIASKMLEMVFSGGGKCNIWGGNVLKIFEDANTKRLTLLRVPTGTEFVVLPVVKVELEGEVVQLSSTGVVNVAGNELTLSIILVAHNEGSINLSVTVKQ